MPNNMHAFENKQKAMTHFRNKRKWTANNVDLRGRIALMTDRLSDKNTLHPFSADKIKQTKGDDSFVENGN